VEFIEAPAFTQFVGEYLSDDGYRELQGHLLLDPEAGEVIPGTGGGRTSVAERESGAGSASSTTTSRATVKSGSSRSTTRTRFRT